MAKEDATGPASPVVVTPAQKNAFVSAFRVYCEAHRRIMDNANQLAGLYTDLNLASLTDADLTGDNAGLSAADVAAALQVAGQIIGEWTPARRAAYNKIGHGSP